MKPSFKNFLQKNQRIVLIILACILVGALFLLAVGMRSMEFRPGRPFVMPEGIRDMMEAAGLSWQLSPIVMLTLVLGSLVLLAITMIILIKSPELRKKIMFYMMQLLLFLFFYILIFSFMKPSTQQPAVPTTEVVQESPLRGTPMPAATAPVVEVFTPKPTTWLTFTITFGIILLIGGIATWVWIRTHPPRQKIQAIAQSALNDLRLGKHWEDVVIQCYGEMSTAAFMRRGIERPGDMTPAEFARRLEAAGIPAGPVRNLTRLFEQARYGRHGSNPQEAQEALACLSQIVAAVDRQK